MGKSPGRWIKTVLFGKKTHKSNFPKNFKPDKKSAVKTSVEDLGGNSPVISDPFQLTDGSVENIQLEKGASGSPCANDALSPVNQVVDSQSNIASGALSDTEMRRQEQAATKAQAIFRGYLARRAFRALKGIIRLQALIRGHLVRRQAVATLRCMHVIIKFQALARGHKDAKLVYTGADSLFRSEKLAANAFVRKLVVLSPAAMPLSLQYDLSEPNAAWNWLERWSLSRFWEPPTRAKKILNTKPQKNQGSPQTVEPESGKSKRTIRKASTAANGDNSALTSFETDKPKRNPRKITNHQTESTQEQPQNELERVKRSLRKISAPAALAHEEPEPETENPPPNSVKMIPDSAALEVSEQEIVISSEKPTDSDVIVDKLVLPEAPSRTVATDDSVNVPFENAPVVETNCSENGESIENSQTLNNGLVSNEEQNGKETQKIRKRRSLPTKQEYPENVAHNTPTLPSYMAATQSAKAKLRAQGSSTVGEDGAEYGNARRHSLPASSTNGKLSSLSPRIQNPVQSNGKGGSKSNRSLMSSRDEKMLQPGWRR